MSTPVINIGGFRRKKRLSLVLRRLLKYADRFMLVIVLAMIIVGLGEGILVLVAYVGGWFGIPTWGGCTFLGILWIVLTAVWIGSLIVRGIIVANSEVPGDDHPA